MIVRVGLVLALALLALSVVRVDREYRDVPPATTSTTFDLDSYMDCYHDPDAERWVPNLPIPEDCP